MKLQIESLQEKIERGIIEQETHKVIEIFLASANDWPVEVLTLEDYEKEIENYIEDITTKVNIERKYSTMDHMKNAWKSEALIQIIEVFDYFNEGISLKNIVDQLRNRV